MAQRNTAVVIASAFLSAPGVFRAPVNTKGSFLIGNGLIQGSLPVGTDGRMIIADSTQTLGVKWGGYWETVRAASIPAVSVGIGGMFTSMADANAAGYDSYKIVSDLTETTLPVTVSGKIYIYIDQNYTLTLTNFTTSLNEVIIVGGTKNNFAGTGDASTLDITVSFAFAAFLGNKFIHLENINIITTVLGVGTAALFASGSLPNSERDAYINNVSFTLNNDVVVGTLHNCCLTNCSFPVVNSPTGLFFGIGGNYSFINNVVFGSLPAYELIMQLDQNNVMSNVVINTPDSLSLEIGTSSGPNCFSNIMGLYNVYIQENNTIFDSCNITGTVNWLQNTVFSNARFSNCTIGNLNDKNSTYSNFIGCIFTNSIAYPVGSTSQYTLFSGCRVGTTNGGTKTIDGSNIAIVNQRPFVTGTFTESILINVNAASGNNALY